MLDLEYFMIVFFNELYGILNSMMPENLKQLGSGIATAHPDKPLDDTIRIRYAPTEDAIPLLRVLGNVWQGLDESHAQKLLQVGKLGVSEFGDIWRKEENGQATMIASGLDLLHTLDAVERSEEGSTLNEFEDRGGGKRILARTLQNGDSPPTLQLWEAKNPKDTQYLVDAVFCLHFHQPASDDQGVKLSEDQILQEALRVGITFNMSMKGEPLLPHLP